MPRLRTAIVVAACLATLSGVASAASPTAWTSKDMTAAVKALRYPKPGAVKVTCRPVGHAFRCAAIYRRKPRTRRFYAEGTALGGWICAGPTVATCKLLRRGFVAASMAPYGVAAEASVSASGYAENKYGVSSTERSASCTPAGTLAWSCPFTAPAATITVTYKPVKGGWLVSATG